MLADDAFRNRLHETIRTLRARCEELKSVASIRETETEDYWGVWLCPHAPTACPLELILHRDQRYDVTIGSETYEHLSADELALLPRLLDSVADGTVITRTWATRATGMTHSIQTIVPLDGSLWQASEETAVAARVPRDDCLATDRHYAPYRARSAAA